MDLPAGVIYAFLLLGFCAAVIPQFVALGMGTKLKAKEFSLQVFLPNVIGIFLLAIGMAGVFQLNYSDSDEKFFYYVVPVVACGALVYSIGAAFMTMIRIRWAAD